MTRWDIILLLFISILSISFSYAVIKTAAENMSYQEQKIDRERRHLPSECEQYYNDGTDRWKECMGVEHK